MARRSTVRLPRRLVMVAALVLAGAVAATGTAAAQPAQQIPLPSADLFYTFDGALGDVAPGTVLRTREVPYAAPDLATPITTTQVLYRTTDQQGAPSVTVATVIRPLLPGPAKLLSFHTAYDGLGTECDPSYTLTGHGSSRAALLEQGVITGYLAAGYSVVVPDYEGEDLAWTVGRQSAHAALDGIRAAEAALSLPASTPVGMIGYSGGSVPTQWGAELAPRYAPELNLVGAAAGGLPVDLAHNLPYVSGSAHWAGVIPALIVAYQRAYGFDPATFLSDRGRQVVGQVESNCIGNFASDYPGLTDAEMVRAPYTSLLDVPEVVAAIDDNIMGSAGTPAVPVLLAVGNVDGTGDSVMIADDVEGLAREYCDRGVAVSYDEYAGRNHADAFFPFQAQATQFLTERFAGLAPGSDCDAVGPGNDLTPTPVP
ncbi:secretory lipase [Rhodococcus rhodochrous J45]|uniref:Secretory lipase n=1 Tax=Rhodococcus rhodochrous J45 TaxID=935266 RepID=A0A562ER91_RHORH|nr:lipase family protein [Rhodococcus rhodochrous]TWH24171.1 secretory lipase [Rhodococcus rhodochrous J45]